MIFWCLSAGLLSDVYRTCPMKDIPSSIRNLIPLPSVTFYLHSAMGTAGFEPTSKTTWTVISMRKLFQLSYVPVGSSRIGKYICHFIKLRSIHAPTSSGIVILCEAFCLLSHHPGATRPLPAPGVEPGFSFK